jgi:predicted Fe-Mo cluster-binding NifX family protein
LHALLARWHAFRTLQRAMKIAVTMHDGRVSPVYGVAREVLLVVIEGGREVHRERRAVNGDGPTRRVRRLVELGVGTLICAGITTSQVELLRAAGISVIDQVTGPVDRVIQNYVDGRLSAGIRSPSNHRLIGGHPHDRASSDRP